MWEQLALTALSNPASIQSAGAAATNILNAAGSILSQATGRPAGVSPIQQVALPPQQVASIANLAQSQGYNVAVEPRAGGQAAVTVRSSSGGSFWDSIFGGEEGGGKAIVWIGIAIAGLLLLGPMFLRR